MLGVISMLLGRKLSEHQQTVEVLHCLPEPADGLKIGTFYLRMLKSERQLHLHYLFEYMSILARHSNHELLLDVVAHQSSLCHDNDLQFKRQISASTLLTSGAVFSFQYTLACWKLKM